MRKILLRFEDAETPRDVQEYLARELSFPEWYGMNLDALYDELTVIGEDLCIGFYRRYAEEKLRGYLDRTAAVFRDAEKENRHLAVIFDEI